MKKFLLLIAVVALIIMPISSAKATHPPLPKDLKIEAPESLEAAEVCGQWGGIWLARGGMLSSGWEVVLVVEEIKGQTARVVYAWDEIPRIGLLSGWERRDAVYDPVSKKITWANPDRGLVFSFTLKGKKMLGVLEGKNTFEVLLEKKR